MINSNENNSENLRPKNRPISQKSKEEIKWEKSGSTLLDKIKSDCESSSQAPLSKEAQKLKNEFEKLYNQGNDLSKTFREILTNKDQGLAFLGKNLSFVSNALSDTKELLDTLNDFSDKLIDVSPIEYFRGLDLKKSLAEKMLFGLEKKNALLHSINFESNQKEDKLYAENILKKNQEKSGVVLKVLKDKLEKADKAHKKLLHFYSSSEVCDAKAIVESQKKLDAAKADYEQASLIMDCDSLDKPEKKKTENTKVSKDLNRSSNVKQTKNSKNNIPNKIFKEDEASLEKMNFNINRILGELECKDLLTQAREALDNSTKYLKSKKLLDEFHGLYSERNELLRSMGKPEFKLDPEFEKFKNKIENSMRQVYEVAIKEKNRSKENYKRVASSSDIPENALEAKPLEILLEKFHKNRAECKRLAELLGEEDYSSGEEWNIYNTKPLIDIETCVTIAKVGAFSSNHTLKEYPTQFSLWMK